MRVLVAGAGGAVGLPLTAQLVLSGHQVLALTRTGRSHRLLRRLGAQPLAVDVLERGSLFGALAGERLDAVVNELTSFGTLAAAHRRMRRTNRLRLEGTSNLLDVARSTGAQRFVTQSMIFGYDRSRWGRGALTESDPFGPPRRGRFEFSVDALQRSESMVRGSRHIEGIALRYGMLYGPGAGSEEMVHGLRRGTMPALRSSRPLSWVYVEDAAAATVAALDRGTPGEAYNVVDDMPVTWTAMLREFADAAVLPNPRYWPGWLLRAAPCAAAVVRGGPTASNEKAKSELDWRLGAPNFRQGVRRAVSAAGGSRSSAGGPRR